MWGYPGVRRGLGALRIGRRAGIAADRGTVTRARDAGDVYRCTCGSGRAGRQGWAAGWRAGGPRRARARGGVPAVCRQNDGPGNVYCGVSVATGVRSPIGSIGKWAKQACESGPSNAPAGRRRHLPGRRRSHVGTPFHAAANAPCRTRSGEARSSSQPVATRQLHRPALHSSSVHPRAGCRPTAPGRSRPPGHRLDAAQAGRDQRRHVPVTPVFAQCGPPATAGPTARRASGLGTR